MAGSVVAALELLHEAIVASSQPGLEVASALEPVSPLPCTQAPQHNGESCSTN